LKNHGKTYIGISYARDGNTPALKLALELKKRRPTRDEKKFLDFVSPIPGLTIKDGRAINRGAIGGGKYSIYELENVAPQIWNIKFGTARLNTQLTTTITSPFGNREIYYGLLVKTEV